MTKKEESKALRGSSAFFTGGESWYTYWHGSRKNGNIHLKRGDADDMSWASFVPSWSHMGLST